MDVHHKYIGNTSSSFLIIFLHEGLGCVEMWKTFPYDLCIKLDCAGFVYDREGYGKSIGSLTNRKADYLHLEAEKLNTIIEEIPENYKYIVLYGHSDGGSIVLEYAKSPDARISAIITEAAHVINEQVTIEGVRTMRPMFDEGKFEGLRKYHGERYKEVFFAWNDIWLSDEFRDWDISDDLYKIELPLLVIQGAADIYGTLKQVDIIEQGVSGQVRRFTPDGVGHAPHKEVPLQVIEQIERFIHEYC